MRFLSPLIKDALYFSAEMHDGQYRKGGKVPYIVHPVLVGLGVSSYTTDDELVAAALLHDVLEDCSSVSKQDIEKRFGTRVATLVDELSFLDSGKDFSSWRDKKEKYLKKIETVSNDALLIVAADKMINMKSYFKALESNEERVRTLFRASPEDYRWYYAETGRILEEKLGKCLAVEDYNNELSLIKK